MKNYLLILLATIGLIQKSQAAVGYRNITYNDPSRAGRAVQIYIYYPAVTATLNAAFSSPASTTYPLVVVGHGFAMDYDTYTWIADSLVPNNYIVAIVNTETGLFGPSHNDYGLDLRFISSKLKSESNTNTASPFYQRLTAKSAVVGHSMGGGCTFLAASGSTEFACIANMAAAETTPSAVTAAATVTSPTLVISGTEDCVAPPASHQDLMYAALTSCRAHVSILNANHCDFAQYDFNCTFGESTCNPTPTMTDVIQMTKTMSVLRPWFDYWLKGACVSWTSFVNASNASGMTTVRSCDPLPDVSFASASAENICLGGGSPTSVTLSPNIVGGLSPISYNWLPTAGLSSTTTLVTNASPSTTTIYTLTATDSNGCTDVVTKTVNVYVTPSPVITGNNSVCSSITETYTVPAIAGTTYNWVVSGGTIISGAGTNTVTVQWNPGVTGTITISQSNP